MCYLGEPYVYSNKVQPTETYPPHVLCIIPTIMSNLEKFIPSNIFTQLSSGIDILYSDIHKGGGSNGAHSDDEDDWGLVVILSFGQTRWLRIREAKGAGEFINVKLDDNSMCVMHGKTFQKKFKHQVDKLGPKNNIYPRLSINIRFKAGSVNVKD